MTVNPAHQLSAARTAHAVARQTFDAQLAQVRADLEARGIGGRIADTIGETAATVMDEAVDVANENRLVIAGTLAALTAWFLRRPIIRFASGVFDEVKERISQ
jgi:hypothetical protein